MDGRSEMEMVASNAERSSIKYKQVEFMKDKLGQVFDGVVSGVTEWGLYVELNDNKCEGLSRSVTSMTTITSLTTRTIVCSVVEQSAFTG